MKILISAIALFTLSALPVLAQSAPTLGNIQVLAQSIGSIVNTLLPIVVAIALLGFFWGLAKFIFAAGDESKKEEGKRVMVWGVIALFVMVSVWGLVFFIGNAVGIGQGQGLGQVPGVAPNTGF